MRIKVCGITSPEDARLVAEAGASLVGTILVPGSPRQVTAEQAGEIGRSVSLPLAIVVAGLSAAEAAAVARTAGARVIQLHGSEPESLVRELRELGDWELWKAVQVKERGDLAEAIDRYADVVDLLLLDAWHPVDLGGTGRRFPWEFLEEARLPESLAVGVAGGLNSGNVREAVNRLRPDLVDVGSGVEASPGKKDPGKVEAFVREAAAAAAELPGEGA